MLRSILVGLDGSAYSATAVDLGLGWAQRHGALLVGIGIVDEPTIRQPEPVPLGGMHYKKERDDNLVADARRRVQEFLQEFARRCAAAKVACKLLEDVGLPYEQIALEAQRYDLILLGQQSHFHFETQAQPDETLTKVLKHSPRPLVTVPGQLQGGGVVVVAYDGSLQAARTLQAFQAMGLGDAQELHVVSVDADPGEAARRAERAVEFLRAHAVTAHPHALATLAKPAQVILDQVRQLNAGLVVMGAYGQPTLREFFFGSVTRTMLRDSPVPLFLYH
jgi:nucleotide-binding universal stress UspA family protein